MVFTLHGLPFMQFRNFGAHAQHQWHLVFTWYFQVPTPWSFQLWCGACTYSFGVWKWPHVVTDDTPSSWTYQFQVFNFVVHQLHAAGTCSRCIRKLAESHLIRRLLWTSIEFYSNQITLDQSLRPSQTIIGSAEALPTHEVRSVREGERERGEKERDTERERERWKWCHHCQAKIVDEFQFPLPKIRTWRWVYTFPCQKCALFVSPFTLPILPFLNGHHYCAESRNEFSLSVAKKISPSLFRLSQVARLFFPSKKWTKLIIKTIGNRKRDCAWRCARGINTTRENLQIAKHKSGRGSFRSPDWLVLCDLQIFSGGVYPPRAQPHSQCIFLFPIVFGINNIIEIIHLVEAFVVRSHSHIK